MVVCILVPRFALLAAVGGREALVREPMALAPEAGREQMVGEVSAQAEAFGVASGMRLGEALSRCPELRLVSPDPAGVRERWAAALDRLERIGAGVESDVPGQAFFEARGLRRLHGGDVEGVVAAARRALAGPARVGVAPARFAAYAAAMQARGRRTVVFPGRAAGARLAPLPVTLLRSRPELAGLPDLLRQLGIATLGAFGALPRPAVAERFGHPGLLALDLAQARDTPLEPRRPPEPVGERLSLPESASGVQLERALELLVARVLARPERRGRTLRAAALSARFVEGGTWRTAVTLRRASADPDRLRLALSQRLFELPAPAEWLALEVEAFGPPAQDQRSLDGVVSARAERRERLDEAVRQVRQSAGAQAALRVLEVDPDSRIPERRALLAPWSEGA